jgi:outer membrane protein assembly factor BamB
VDSDNGSSFTVVVTNAAGSVTSQAATLTVTVTGTDVVTYKYDVMRTGQNLVESTLTPSNVAFATFGKLRNLMVDGLVDAQPLYLSQLAVAGAMHNVVFVATEHDSVYAFDSDTGAILWNVSLLGAGETTSDDHTCYEEVYPEIGITSTPVIDRKAGAHGTIFLVAMTKDAASNYHQRLHALDVTTGKEVGASPTEIEATFEATTFAPGQYKERAALLLNNGTIYTAWASHCDTGAYGGWIIALSESTLAITGILNVAKDASGLGPAEQGPSIWMSGGGPAADSAGNVYVLTANGRFETTLSAAGFPDGGDYGNSFVKISTSGGALAVSDYFTMSGEISESQHDLDLASGGIMLLPDMTDSGGMVRQLAVGAGKDGNMYVVDRNNMGKFTSVGNNIWQQLNGALGAGIWATPAYFNSVIYYGPTGGSLMAFTVTDALVSTSPTSQTSKPFAYPGTFPVVSANGTANAIVWAYENTQPAWVFGNTSPAVLHAYAAGDLSTELYNSDQAPNERDQVGLENKNIVPVVADGKVFVATRNSVAVFGLLP